MCLCSLIIFQCPVLVIKSIPKFSPGIRQSSALFSGFLLLLSLYILYYRMFRIVISYILHTHKHMYIVHKTHRLGTLTFTAKRIPCGMTQISLGATVIRPSSVVTSKTPCCGTVERKQIFI